MCVQNAARLPANKPRYVMGVGYPLDLVVCVALGADMYVNIEYKLDCSADNYHFANSLTKTKYLYCIRLGLTACILLVQLDSELH